MTHIIFAGDSFTEDQRSHVDFDYTCFKNNNYDYITVGAPNTIKIQSFFAIDMLEQNIDNVKIHTVAKGSYGNHVISDKFKTKVNEIQETNPGDKIIAIIQFSAFVRTNCNIDIVDKKAYPYDYFDDDDYLDSDILFKHHFNNILNLNEFCVKNDITSFMYFGWANIFSLDIYDYRLESEIDKMKKFITFIDYKDCEDEMRFYCAGPKDVIGTKTNTFGLMQVNKMKGDVYGGLTEYSREVLEMGRRYHLPIDPHPSSEAYYVFYKDYIKKFLSNNGILLDKDPNQNITDLYKKYFDFEYSRFKILSEFETMDYNFIHNKTRDIVKSNVWEYKLIEKAFKNEKQIMGLW
jgi:hypothetical protein